jgi:3-deoxy-D-manno-octulosonate 8-phosphate phosphatase (KDO 8-P phosphatase)
MSGITDEVRERIRKVKALVLDVDGVLTDGRLVYLPDGKLMPSGFHVHDGMGMRTLGEAGLKVFIVSGNWTESVRLRAEHLRVTESYLGVGDKVGCLNRICADYGLLQSELAYVGDDLNDLPAMHAAGFAVAVRQAAPEVREAAAYVTEREGGFGAVREVCELILKTQGLWDTAVGRFMADVEAHGFRPPKG